jgi:polysaccharide deacetylase family sporulation protein PdaB
LGFLIMFLFVAGVFISLHDEIVTWPVFATQDRLVPIYAVATDEKKVAISFDAAWGAEYTREILAILDQYDIKTTFFLVKFWMEKYPEETKLIATKGHEIGNHSATHPHMNALSEDEIYQELLETNRLIERLVGKSPRLFRPPFGEYNNRLITVVEDLGMKTIQWSIDSLDWRDPSPEEITDWVLGQIEPGAIVLFHNNAKNTPPALVPILEQLLADGYQVVPISELIMWENYYINPNTGVQEPLPEVGTAGE